jgi:hypothetical protein
MDRSTPNRTELVYVHANKRRRYNGVVSVYGSDLMVILVLLVMSIVFALLVSRLIDSLGTT